MSEELAILRDIEDRLSEFLKWTKFAGMQELRTILMQTLENDAAMLAYEFSDGNRTTREIAKLAGIKSHNTIAVYWRKWSKLSIVEPSVAYQGRYKRLCSLEEVGITVPSLPQSPEIIHTEPTTAVEENE